MFDDDQNAMLDRKTSGAPYYSFSCTTQLWRHFRDVFVPSIANRELLKIMEDFFNLCDRVRHCKMLVLGM